MIAREHGPGVLVAALSSAFGAAIIQGTGLLDAAIRANAVTGSSATVGVLLQVTAAVFIAIAVKIHFVDLDTIQTTGPCET